MKLLATLNPEKIFKEEADSYRVREAVRAVVIDSEQKVALLHVARDQYYKLPGGGIESDENHHEALQRECMEEIGSQVDVLNEIGMIVEERKFYTLRQISYCYFAKQKGERNKPSFTEKEIEEGFEQVWVPYSEAVALLSRNEAVGLEGRSYITPRDLIFLKTAEELVKGMNF